MRMPFVSVVLNCYNGAAYLREAIDSVYAQSHPHWEIIFYDNASTDQSPVIARSYDARLKYVRSEENLPLGGARHQALIHARGDFIAFIDCDDVWHPEKLTKQLQAMMDAQADLSYTGYQTIDEKGDLLRAYSPKNRQSHALPDLLNRYELNQSSCMLRRKFLLEHQLSFHPQLSYCPDYLLYMQIVAKGRVAVVDTYLLHYRVHENQLTHQLGIKVPLETRYALRQLLMSCPEIKRLFPRQCQAAKDSVRYFHIRYLMGRQQHAIARQLMSCIKTKKLKYMLLVWQLKWYTWPLRSFRALYSPL